MPQTYFVKNFSNRPLNERFWEKINKNGPIPMHCPELGNCWEFMGHRMGTSRKTVTGFPKKGSGGHGLISYNGKPTLTHRVSWLIHYGPIKEDSWVLHRCDNRACVRPEHLFLGNHQDNMRDMMKKDRQPKGSQKTQAIVSDQDVIEIRDLWKHKIFSQPEIGRMYGIKQPRVSMIVNKKGWKHLI